MRKYIYMPLKEGDGQMLVEKEWTEFLRNREAWAGGLCAKEGQVSLAEMTAPL